MACLVKDHYTLSAAIRGLVTSDSNWPNPEVLPDPNIGGVHGADRPTLFPVSVNARALATEDSEILRTRTIGV